MRERLEIEPELLVLGGAFTHRLGFRALRQPVLQSLLGLLHALLEFLLQVGVNTVDTLSQSLKDAFDVHNGEFKYVRLSLLLLLSLVEGQEGNALDTDDLESDAWNITLGLALLTEACHEHFVVFVEEVQATISGDECSDLLSVFGEHDTDALAHGRVGLLRFHTDFLDDEALGHAAAHEGVFEAGGEHARVVLVVGPPVDLPFADQLSCRSNSSRFA